jgi:thymidylate synthase
MFFFKRDNLNSLYSELINSLSKYGKEIVKEGRKIKELYPCVIKITNPKEGILVIKGRPYSPAFAIAEAVWNLAGDSDDWLCKYNPVYKKYFTDGKLTAGYGNRIFNWDNNTNQFELVAQRLENEPQTLHGSITVFNPTHDLKKPKFVPCITRIKFTIRENKLFMTSFMRAQDIWLGFPYDINLLLTIFQLMSNRLKIEMGDYYHYCDVLRLYEDNYEPASKIENNFVDCDNQINLEGKCDFQKFDFYKSILKDLPENSLELISEEPEYWKNGIKCCIAYNYLHRGMIQETAEIIDTVSNCFKTQFEIWAEHYHKHYSKSSE